MLIERVARWLFWATIVAISASTLSPIEFRPRTGESPDLERVFAFAILGAALSVAYPKRRLIGFLLAVGFAAVLEAGQNFIASRHGRVHDFVIKALGITAGMVCLWVLRRVYCGKS